MCWDLLYGESASCRQMPGYSLQVLLATIDLCALSLAKVRGGFGVKFKARKKLPFLSL